jgi:hypothetical protein
VPDAQADDQSGTRLKANFYVGADGSRQFAYFTDTARNNEQCTFAVAADNALRCMPLPEASAAIYFADVNCTQPLAYPLQACMPTPYVYVTDSACAPTTGYHIFATTQTRYPVDTDVWVGSGGGSNACIRYTPPPYFLYTTGPEIPSASFEQGSVQVQ